jgi:hypothetical protein
MGNDGVSVGAELDPASAPVYVEVVVGDPHDATNTARARLSLPADVVSGGGGVGGSGSGGAGRGRSDPCSSSVVMVTHIGGGADGGEQRRQSYAIQRRWDSGGACILDVCTAAAPSPSFFPSLGGEAKASDHNTAARQQAHISEGRIELSLPLASLSIVDGNR